MHNKLKELSIICNTLMNSKVCRRKLVRKSASNLVATNCNACQRPQLMSIAWWPSLLVSSVVASMAAAARAAAQVATADLDTDAREVV